MLSLLTGTDGVIEDPAAPEADVEHVAEPAVPRATPVLKHMTSGRFPSCLDQAPVTDGWTLTGAFPDGGTCSGSTENVLRAIHLRAQICTMSNVVLTYMADVDKTVGNVFEIEHISHFMLFAF